VQKRVCAAILDKRQRSNACRFRRSPFRVLERSIRVSLPSKRPSKICMPPVASNGEANTASAHPVRAVQVGKTLPASRYLAGSIRIGVPEECLAAKHLERSDSNVLIV